MAALTLLAAGAGAFFGLNLVDFVASSGAARHGPTAEAAHGPVSPSNLRPLPPVITNLADPPNVSIRLDAALVFADPAPPQAEALASAIAEDILAFLRTVSLRQIEGPSGLQHLREDLVERASIRAEGEVRDLVIQTLVVQ
ncbi:flagellar basal body-associated FliL family protein [Faunimonas sp. B44]|uniref:flagellar basal body-associated FliL family protein n=1 Tax=Faunimonas sp. B44 TaxID=3461493 RepID=UPI004043AA5E